MLVKLDNRYKSTKTSTRSAHNRESCVSSVEEDECFCDVVSLVNSHEAASLNSFLTRSLSSIETNLDGLVMGHRQPSKSDQVTDLNEKAYLTQKSQVPELNKTHLVEGKRQLKNDDSHLEILSNMMEEETHVDSTSSGKQVDICQVLLDIVEDQSEVHRRAVMETAISGHPQSNQLRLGKPDGEPGAHIPTTNSDRQSQKVSTGNLSLNSPNIVVSNMFHDLYCCLKCMPMDDSGI